MSVFLIPWCNNLRSVVTYLICGRDSVLFLLSLVGSSSAFFSRHSATNFSGPVGKTGTKALAVLGLHQ